LQWLGEVKAESFNIVIMLDFGGQIHFDKPATAIFISVGVPRSVILFAGLLE
jgi:hypothetical protein